MKILSLKRPLTKFQKKLWKIAYELGKNDGVEEFVKMRNKEMDRDCNICVYSTREGGCINWNCEGTKTVNDIRAEERVKVIDEYKKALLQAFNETNINDYGFYPQNVVDMVAIKLKEQK